MRGPLSAVRPGATGRDPFLIVRTTIQFSLDILAEPGPSDVGIGPQPPLPSSGRMLAEAQTIIYVAPCFAIFPGLAIVLAAPGLNLTGEGLRDQADPRTRRAR